MLSCLNGVLNVEHEKSENFNLGGFKFHPGWASPGVATLQAARGDYSYLNSLVVREADRYELVKALGLPFDWTTLKQQISDLPEKVPEKDRNYIVEVSNESAGVSTKRSL